MKKKPKDQKVKSSYIALRITPEVRKLAEEAAAKAMAEAEVARKAAEQSAAVAAAQIQ